MCTLLLIETSFEKDVLIKAYKIDDSSGNIYTLIGTDGTTQNLPIWQLIKVNSHEVKRIGKRLMISELLRMF